MFHLRPTFLAAGTLKMLGFRITFMKEKNMLIKTKELQTLKINMANKRNAVIISPFLRSWPCSAFTVTGKTSALTLPRGDWCAFFLTHSTKASRVRLELET